MATNHNNNDRPRRSSTERERLAARHDRMLHGWTVGGRERFPEDGGEAATLSAHERGRYGGCRDLRIAIARGVAVASNLRMGYTVERVAEKLGNDLLFGGAAVERTIADYRLLQACERGMLAHVGCGHEAGGNWVDGGVFQISAMPDPALPLDLVQAEIVAGVRDFDGEYTDQFSRLRERDHRLEAGATGARKGEPA